jgi:hypothetical protein
LFEKKNLSIFSNVLLLHYPSSFHSHFLHQIKLF